MSKQHASRGLVWAVLWILVGIAWLLSNRGIIPHNLLSWERDWPIVLVLIGGVMLWNILTRRTAAPAAYDIEDAPARAGGRRVRVMVNDANATRVNIAVPLSVASALLKLGGCVNVHLPESARAKLREKGLDFEQMPAEQLVEALRACAADGPVELINMVDDKDGTTVRISIE